MKLSLKAAQTARFVAAAIIAICSAPLGNAHASTTAPSVETSRAAGQQRTPQDLFKEMAADQKAVNELLGKQNEAIKKPADRMAVAPKLFPLIHRMRGDLTDLSVAVPKLKEQIAGSQMQLMALLSALGEKDASDQIQAMVISNDPAQALTGKAHELMVRFYLTDNSLPAQAALVDDVEKLDQANTSSVLLTQLTIEMSHDEGSPDLKDRLQNIASEEMYNPLAASLKEQLAAKKEADAQDALRANKPLTLAGKLVGGEAFSTDSMKGKVVLVDFWATWCGPCKAELPRVKKLYDDYHAKGLEVVGVSNDYDTEALKGFVASAELPWPQLFDAAAAANHQFNSLTSDQKIDGIPVMYLIDKKGILRTVNARANMEELIPKLLAEGSDVH